MDRPYRLLTLAAAVLASCATRQPPPHPIEDPAIEKLQAAATEVAQSLQQLAQTQRAATPRPATYAVPQSGPLAQAVTLSWAGPPEPVLRLLATLIGYDFRTVGKAPLTPDVVNIEVQRRAAWSLLEDIGWQLGDRATVVVDERLRGIQLIYIGQQP